MAVAFVFSVLSDLCDVISSQEKPQHSWLIQLRMDCWLSTEIIRLSCPVLTDFKKAGWIENYNMPLHIKHYSLEER